MVRALVALRSDQHNPSKDEFIHRKIYSRPVYGTRCTVFFGDKGTDSIRSKR